MPSTRSRPAARPAVQETQTVTDVQTAEPTNATNADAPAEGAGAGANGASAEANGKSKKNSAPIQLTVPLDLKTRIEDRVKERNASSSARYILEQFVKQELPDYSLPPMTR